MLVTKHCVSKVTVVVMLFYVWETLRLRGIRYLAVRPKVKAECDPRFVQQWSLCAFDVFLTLT